MSCLTCSSHIEGYSLCTKTRHAQHLTSGIPGVAHSSRCDLFHHRACLTVISWAFKTFDESKYIWPFVIRVFWLGSISLSPATSDTIVLEKASKLRSKSRAGCKSYCWNPANLQSPLPQSSSLNGIIVKSASLWFIAILYASRSSSSKKLG